MVGAGLEGEDLVRVVGALDKYNLVLVRVVQRLGRVGLHAEVEGCCAFREVVAGFAVVGDGEELGAAEAGLSIPAGGEDGGVGDCHFDGFGGDGFVELDGLLVLVGEVGREGEMYEGTGDVGEVEDGGPFLALAEDVFGAVAGGGVGVEGGEGGGLGETAVPDDGAWGAGVEGLEGWGGNGAGGEEEGEGELHFEDV